MRLISATLFLEEMAGIRAFVPPLCRLRLQHRRNLHTVTFRCDNFFVDYIRWLYGIYAWPGCVYFGERATEVVLDQRRLTF